MSFAPLGVCRGGWWTVWVGHILAPLRGGGCRLGLLVAVELERMLREGFGLFGGDAGGSPHTYLGTWLGTLDWSAPWASTWGCVDLVSRCWWFCITFVPPAGRGLISGFILFPAGLHGCFQWWRAVQGFLSWRWLRHIVLVMLVVMGTGSPLHVRIYIYMRVGGHFVLY